MLAFKNTATSRRAVAIASLFVLAGISVAGCAGEGSTQAPTTVTVPAQPPQPAANAVPAAPPASSVAAPALVSVPDVSGMNHQDAQDTMQAAGLYNLREVDGTGQGRVLLLDRNWIQTGQDPAPGTKVSPDTVITLTAVKSTD